MYIIQKEWKNLSELMIVWKTVGLRNNRDPPLFIWIRSSSIFSNTVPGTAQTTNITIDDNLIANKKISHRQLLTETSSTLLIVYKYGQFILYTLFTLSVYCLHMMALLVVSHIVWRDWYDCRCNSSLEK